METALIFGAALMVGILIVMGVSEQNRRRRVAANGGDGSAASYLSGDGGCDPGSSGDGGCSDGGGGGGGGD